MKVLGISCGRRNSNTEIMVKEGLMGREEANPEVNRFISSRQLDDPRINSRAGHYTKPAWTEWGSFPFIEPYESVVGIFITTR